MKPIMLALTCRLNFFNQSSEAISRDPTSLLRKLLIGSN